MFELNCAKEECFGVMVLNYDKSLQIFLEDVDYIVDDLGKICDIAVNTVLVYRCNSCGYENGYTLAELELKTRQNVAKEVKQYRKNYVFREFVTPKDIDPDNGLEFCGRCAGVDNEGNCFTDIISKCPFRR